VRLDAAFDKQHKHLFNEFGINLRKNRMLDQALDYYKRAEDLTQTDENLHYNIARAFFEKNDVANCFEYLKKALAINPELSAARKFITYLVDKNFLAADVAAAITAGAAPGMTPDASPPDAGPVSDPPA
jgi:tetratricopeptide (TPR) repeat protein